MAKAEPNKDIICNSTERLKPLFNFILIHN